MQQDKRHTPVTKRNDKREKILNINYTSGA